MVEAENTSKDCQYKINKTEENKPPAHSKPVSINQVNVSKHRGFQKNPRAATHPPSSIPSNSCQPAVPLSRAPCPYCCPPQANTHTPLTCLNRSRVSVQGAYMVDNEEYNDYPLPTYDKNEPNVLEEEEHKPQYQHYSSVPAISHHVQNAAQQKSVPQSKHKDSHNDEEEDNKSGK